jgi:hypothetical protein
MRATSDQNTFHLVPTTQIALQLLMGHRREERSTQRAPAMIGGMQLKDDVRRAIGMLPNEDFLTDVEGADQTYQNVAISALPYSPRWPCSLAYRGKSTFDTTPPVMVGAGK